MYMCSTSRRRHVDVAMQVSALVLSGTRRLFVTAVEVPVNPLAFSANSLHLPVFFYGGLALPLEAASS